MEILSSLEKRIYNTFLRISRSSKNQPFRLREDFSDFENDKNYIFVKRLSLFFSRHPNIDLDDYFQAPHKLYSQESTYYDLAYYNSPKASKAYSIYIAQKQNADVDSSEQLQDIKKSLQFIYSFCQEKKISIDDYIDYKEQQSINSEFLTHLQSHQVNIYTLFGFDKFEKNLKATGFDVVNFILGEDFYNKISLRKTQFFTSTTAAKLVISGLKLLKNKQQKALIL